MRASSASEACGVPTQTASSGAPTGAAPTPSRTARSRAASTTTVRSGSPPCSAASSVGASGVTPTAWKSATAPRRGGGRADRLEAILVGVGRQADDDGDLLARLGADDEAEQR